MGWKYKKMILLEIAFVLIAILYMPWAMISDAYIQTKTVPQPCSDFVSDTTNAPCRVDDPIAKQLVNLRDGYDELSNSPIGEFWSDLPNQTAGLFVTGRVASIAGDVLQVVYNFIFLNVLFFIGYRAGNRLR